MVKYRLYNIVTAFLCICMAGVTIFLGELLIQRDQEHEKALVHDTLMNSGSLIAQAIQKNISHGLYATETLEVLLKSDGYRVDRFNEWGRQIVDKDLAASTVQFAPGGVVRYIYPLEGNEAVLGHDLLKDSRRDDGALKAVISREATFVGPIKLIQNGKYAVIARKPIFVDGDGGERFWGFSIALLLVEDILPEVLERMEAKGLYLRLEGDDPDAAGPPLLYVSPGWQDKNPLTMDIEVPNGRWTLQLGHAPIHGEHYFLFRVVCFLLGCGGFAYVFVQQYRMRARQREILRLNGKLMELSLMDDLTGVGNRRAGLRVLDYEIRKGTRYDMAFSVAMIDLDYFKKVNDEHGHPVGDRLLQHVAGHLEASFRESDSVFRYGGDEFLVVFPRTPLQDAAKAVGSMVERAGRKPCVAGGCVLPVSMSIGLTEYRTGESVRSLLQRVDEILYEAKAAGRNTLRYRA